MVEPAEAEVRTGMEVLMVRRLNPLLALVLGGASPAPSEACAGHHEYEKRLTLCSPIALGEKRSGKQT